LTKRSPIYKRVLRLVDILIQLPSNKISIIFWQKGQVVRSDAQVGLMCRQMKPHTVNKETWQLEDAVEE